MNLKRERFLCFLFGRSEVFMLAYTCCCVCWCGLSCCHSLSVNHGHMIIEIFPSAQIKSYDMRYPIGGIHMPNYANCGGGGTITQLVCIAMSTSFPGRVLGTRLLLPALWQTTNPGNLGGGGGGGSCLYIQYPRNHANCFRHRFQSSGTALMATSCLPLL